MFLMGKRLKECRIACGLSQEQLIDAVMKLPDNRGKERSEKQISYLENGTRPISVEYASLLAQVLNVRVEYLLLKDDFRTEHEMFEDGLRGLHNVYSNIVNLSKLHGYDIQEVDLSESNDFTKLIYSDNAVKISSRNGNVAMISHKQWRTLISEINRFVAFELSGLPFRTEGEHNG